MNKLLESAGIALDAIWGAKLRSLMTVLGNIVAVTSIIAVVSLIQGLNASVTKAILNQAGADSFSIQQFPVTRSDEEFDEVRNNPRITLQRRARHPALRRRRDRGGDGRLDRQRPRHVPRQVDRQHARSRASRSDYVNFSTFDAERGRLMSPTEVDTARPVAVLGWQTADRLFGDAIDPIDKMIQIEGVHFRVVGVSAKKGSFLGQSQDEFAIIPLGQFQMIFGSRRSLIAHGQAARPRRRSTEAMDEATVALRSSARPAGRSSRTTSACSRRTRFSTSTTRRPTASSRCWSASSRCRWSSAASSS